MQATSSASLDEMLAVPSEEALAERPDEASVQEFARVFEEALSNVAARSVHAEETPEEAPVEVPDEAPDDTAEASPLLANAPPESTPATLLAQAFAGAAEESQRATRDESADTGDVDRVDDAHRRDDPRSQARPDGVDRSGNALRDRSITQLEAARADSSPERPANAGTSPTGAPVQATSEAAPSRDASAPPILSLSSSEARASELAAPQLRSARPIQPRAVRQPVEPDAEEPAPAASDRRIAPSVIPTERTAEARAPFERPVADERASAPPLPPSPQLTNGELASNAPSVPPVVPAPGAAVGLSAAQATMPAPPAGAPQPVEALSQHVEMLATRGGGTAHIRLHPERLGELDITVSMRGNHVEVVIRAEEPAAQAAVLAHRDQLVDSLGARELRMESFDVRGGGRDPQASDERAFGEQGGEGLSREDRNPRGRDDVPGGFAPPTARRVGVTSNPAARAGIDLRI